MSISTLAHPSGGRICLATNRLPASGSFVGYGDIYPKTAVGKVLRGFVAFIGIGMFALPAGILGAGFLETRHRRDQDQ